MTDPTTSQPQPPFGAVPPPSTPDPADAAATMTPGSVVPPVMTRSAASTPPVRGRHDGKPKKPSEHVNELKDLVVGYAKQETVDPLKNLGRYLGFGLGGAAAIGLGSVLLLLALLRGLQSIDVFSRVGDEGGTWTFVPYVATALAGFLVVGLAAMAIVREPRRRRDGR